MEKIVRITSIEYLNKLPIRWINFYIREQNGQKLQMVKLNSKTNRSNAPRSYSITIWMLSKMMNSKNSCENDSSRTPHFQ